MIDYLANSQGVKCAMIEFKNETGINRLTLSFFDDLEDEFLSALFRRSLKQVRLALVFGICLYGIFGVLDYWLAPWHLVALLRIRFGLVIPFMAGVIIFSYTRYFKKCWQLCLSLTVIFAGLGVIAMMAIAPQQVTYSYYAGLILIFIYGYSFIGLRFIWATVAGWVIVLAYELSVVWLGSVSTVNIINNNFFFIGGNLIGMFASYTIELYARREFWQAHRLKEEKKKVSAANVKLDRALHSIQKDLEAAGEIQRSLLPPRSLNMEGIEAVWFFEPSEKVGGDLMNIFRLDDSHIGFYILDVAGHGVQAALLSVTLSRMLTNWSEEDNLLVDVDGTIHPPVEVVETLNKRFLITEDTMQFFTMIYGVLDTSQRVLRYVRAGHPPLLAQFPGHDVQEWHEGDSGVGFFKECTFNEQVKHLPSGSRLFLISDGIIEARNRETDECFSLEQVTGIINENPELPLQETTDVLMDRLHTWIGRPKSYDDITMLALEIK